MSTIRTMYLETAAAVVELLKTPELGAAWDSSSVLPAFRVSGLTGHLARSIFQVDEYLDAPVGGGPHITAAVYFGELERTTEIGSPFNMSIRDRGELAAQLGHEQLAAATEAQLDTLRDKVMNEAAIRRVQVLQGRVLMLDEYLKTRIVEMVVHIEDLALSIDTGVALPVQAISIATDTMSAAARIRHGDLAFLRGMTRRERDTIDATRVF